MRIVAVTEANRTAWEALRRELWPARSPAKSSAETAAVLTGRGRVAFLAETEAGTVAGFVEAAVQASEAGTVSRPLGSVEAIYVRPGDRGRGIGRRLLARAERWARAQGCREMGSAAGAGDQGGIAFHLAAGFREVDRRVLFLKAIAGTPVRRSGAADEAGLPDWLPAWMAGHGITLWGVADLKGLETPRDETGQGFPFALAWTLPVRPAVMAGIRRGPTPAYAEAYLRLNREIDELGIALASKLRFRGARALPLPASERVEPASLRALFPHKTAATRAGLGWVGRNGQLVTRPFGPWVRLGTVFTDLPLPGGTPDDRSRCGRCRRCVEACPAGALTGASWQPGIPREALLDVAACDRWKQAHFSHIGGGHLCGICSSVCPRGRRTLTRA